MPLTVESVPLTPPERLPSSPSQPSANLAGLAVRWGETDSHSDRLAHASTSSQNARQPGQFQAAGNSRLCQSPKHTTAALFGGAKPPASHSSVPLLEVLTTYHKRKPGRLAQDLNKRPELKEFLKLEGATLRFRQNQLTDQQFKTFISALKKAGHALGSQLPGQLKKAWHSNKDGGVAQQVARHSASLPQENASQHERHQPVETCPTPAYIRAPSNDAQESVDTLNPFAYDDDDNAPFEELSPVADANDELYPKDRNPFAADNDESSSEMLNPFADADEVLSTNPFNSPDEPPVAGSAEQLDTRVGLPVVFLQLLNTYLKTNDGQSFVWEENKVSS